MEYQETDEAGSISGRKYWGANDRS